MSAATCSYRRAALALRPDSVSHALEACINIHSKESKVDEGALWTTVSLRIERQGKNVLIVFDLELYWNATFSPFRLRTPRQREISQMVLSTFFNDEETTTTTTQAAETTWTPLDFYEAAFVPPVTDGSALAIEVPGLNASLYPYQKRTLKWLLHREGMRWVPPSDGSAAGLKSVEDPVTLQPARSFGEIASSGNVQWYLSHLYHAISPEPSAFLSAEKEVRGGILSEEMGLGKTLEIIGLILLHRRPPADEDSYLNVNNERLLKSGATLIVCPESLRQQWMDELERHAPHLLVSYYPGRAQFRNQSEEEVFRNMAAHDVIVTTYRTLTAEIHYATKPPERSRRREREYERPKSPLTQISWWRVCLDEAQMIETGVSAAALVARVLHRVNAWGVTGTPVKKDVQDLLGLLLFLRFEPYCSSPQVWKALTKNHKPLFHDLFHDIAIRHTKKLVRDELELPAQKRFVITLPFTAVEEQHYQSIFAEMAEVCNVDLDGNPMLADWDPKSYEEAMRTYLNRLRQAALHPEVGVQNRRALGHRAGPLRTVDEVLTAMIEQSDASIRTEQRAYFTARLNHGQLLENGPLVKEALAIWNQTRREVEEVVGRCRQELDAAMNAAKRTNSENGAAPNTNGTPDEDVIEGLDEYQASPEVGEALMRLRSALEVQHRAIFFCANARFQIKSNPDFTEPDSAEFSALQKLEEEGYETAKGVRREILSENHKKATKAMRKLGNDAASQNFVTIPELIPNPVKGLESAAVVEKVEELYGFLNLQANLIDEWREVIVGLLLQPLVDEENETETTGDELVNSTAIQEQLMVHVQVLRATIADRQDAISGLQNLLVKHETQTTKALAMDGEGPAPKTLIELLDVRNKVKPSLEKHGCLRGAIGELRALAARLPPHEPGKESRANMEHAVVNRQIKDIQAQIQAQTKASQRLERECDEFTNAMNLRLDYYRQLQAISDSVDVYEGPKTQDVLTKWANAAETAHRKLSSAEAKHRYLVSLRDGGASKANEPKMCIICQTDFTIGVLTVCGHQFCKHCLMLWFKAHHNCPMCKRKLKITDLHTITLKPRELTLHTEDVTMSTPGKKRSTARNKSAIYSEFGADKLAQIRDVDLEGPPLTTKVDSIVRHLLWLRESDPGAKSIVFSQYRDFLQVIGSALSRSRIGYTSIDKPNGVQRFKEDAGMECFLLHGRAQSSGLNLVNASHVFLCEPLLNTAIELQAIARVDRIGQQHETTVWLYLVEGTVEESIYNLSVKRRLQHLSSVTKGKSKETTPDVLEPTLEAANTFEMENASLSKLMSKDRSAGEAVDKEDLWECLFGHVARAANSESREERRENPAVMNLLAAEAAESRRMVENASQLET
ncbi:E3 ubiquitin-protein ligase SHPRH [Verticillium dahliae VdLs.17]|uniref:E3 ubiquitin-protein ligase SHPRH n=1 Tax=Verticillium dahliae (strain VdLs.17 / ATCC MYA-4575 / FGSC 10137) TaxID=498257 RepID=G2WUD2_VERDV|nr:E3 ubiquitin-protein ligase SHPRH [Verticillium dahliae VdLs.17]EGY17723.1 E3 ubiquitin-protein ligase SHPRH [Verticillium dahliae VdLs.17]